MTTARMNLVANWDNDYKGLAATYRERSETPADLASQLLCSAVFEDITGCLKYPNEARIIEVGGGGARVSLFLATKGLDVTCLDFSPEAIALAKRNFSGLGAYGRFIQADLMRAELQPGSFDCVMSYGLLEHFENVGPLLRRMTALLKKGGIHIHTIIPSKFSTETAANVLWFPLRVVKNLVELKLNNVFSRSYRDFPHYENSLSAGQYCEAFRQVGNRVVKCVAMGAVFPMVALPAGLGNLLVRRCQGTVTRLMEWANRSQSRLMHCISPMIYLVCQRTGADPVE